MRTHRPVIAGLCAAIALLMVADRCRADSPQLLRAAESREPRSPFEAALEDNVPPPQRSPSIQYPGRTTQDYQPHSVTDADQPTTADAAADSWGDGQIEQTQYPLTEPLPSEAPDEPRLLPPLADPGFDEPEPLLSLSDTRVELTALRGSGNKLGITSFGIRTAVASEQLPGFSLRPIFGMHLLDGPKRTDLPGQVYDVSLEARMYWPFGDDWLGEFAIAPGHFSDFRTSRDSFRLVSRAVGYYKWADDMRLAIGATYLDRQDITWLPIGGVIWTPNEDWRYEIMFPRPRIAHRYLVESHRERWVYLLGELGGGSWAVERSFGIDDIATYRDYRLLLGIEFKPAEGHSWLLEAGYAFGRMLEYKSRIGNFAPDPTAIIRAALDF